MKRGVTIASMTRGLVARIVAPGADLADAHGIPTATLAASDANARTAAMGIDDRDGGENPNENDDDDDTGDGYDDSLHDSAGRAEPRGLRWQTAGIG